MAREIKKIYGISQLLVKGFSHEAGMGYSNIVKTKINKLNFELL